MSEENVRIGWQSGLSTFVKVHAPPVEHTLLKNLCWDIELRPNSPDDLTLKPGLCDCRVLTLISAALCGSSAQFGRLQGHSPNRIALVRGLKPPIVCANVPPTGCFSGSKYDVSSTNAIFAQQFRD